jgi:hypothetical protein
MGTILNGIINIVEPAAFSLSRNPNFLQLIGIERIETRQIYELNIHSGLGVGNAVFQIVELFGDLEAGETEGSFITGDVHEFRGFREWLPPKAGTFNISFNPADTAQNIKRALLQDSWINARYNVSVPLVLQNGNLQNGAVVRIEAKGAGSNFGFMVVFPAGGSGFFGSRWIEKGNHQLDFVRGEEASTEIEIDVYGETEKPVPPIIPNFSGVKIATLQKTYIGDPLWFNLNGVFDKTEKYNKPESEEGWYETGTAHTFRVLARVNDISTRQFYVSDNLTVINGGVSATEDSFIGRYVFNGNAVQLLTRKPCTNYVRGQKEYINFIRGEVANGVTVRVNVNAYDINGALLGSELKRDLSRTEMRKVNTFVTNFDDILERYPKAAFIKACLLNGNIQFSNFQEYKVSNICQTQSFTFLNPLGGWDSYTFETRANSEIQPQVETYNKTVTPEFEAGHPAEAVHDITLRTTHTVVGKPVNDEVAEWLKDFARSRAVFDENGKYVIIEDFTLRAVGFNAQIPALKYRFSEW